MKIIAPPNSYIDMLNFTSAQDLAKYILYLNNSDAEYIKYFQWKRYYKVKRNSIMYKGVFCEFCRYMYTVQKHAIIHNFTRWFFDQSECNNNKVSLILQKS